MNKTDLIRFFSFFFFSYPLVVGEWMDGKEHLLTSTRPSMFIVSLVNEGEYMWTSLHKELACSSFRLHYSKYRTYIYTCKLQPPD